MGHEVEQKRSQPQHWPQPRPQLWPRPRPRPQSEQDRIGQDRHEPATIKRERKEEKVQSFSFILVIKLPLLLYPSPAQYSVSARHF